MLFNRFFKSEAKPPEKPRSRSSQPARERTQRSRKLHEKMNVKDLRVGMFVVELDKPWEESGFMFQGVELKSTSDVLAVQKECKFVWVDYDEFSLQGE